MVPTANVLSDHSPFVPASDPQFNELGLFVSPPSVVRGIPWWAWKIIILSATFTGIVMYTIYNMPNVFYTNEMSIDPELVEMKVEELTGRHHYDERNKAIYQRRLLITAAQKAYAANGMIGP
jgi:hypothetical protein